MPYPVYGPCGCGPDKRAPSGIRVIRWREIKMAMQTHLSGGPATHSGAKVFLRASVFVLCLAAGAVAITRRRVLTNDGDGVVVRLLEERMPIYCRALSGLRTPLAHWLALNASLRWWYGARRRFRYFVRRRRFVFAKSCRMKRPARHVCAEMNTRASGAAVILSLIATSGGPRFTIIRAYAYDRPFTVMAARFPCVRNATANTAIPYDRRFHASRCLSVMRAHLGGGANMVRAEKEAALRGGGRPTGTPEALLPLKGWVVFIWPATRATTRN